MTMGKIWGFGLAAAVVAFLFGMVLIEGGRTFAESALWIVVCFLMVYVALRTLGR